MKKLSDGKNLCFELSDNEIFIHDTNKFEMRFVKGKFNITNDGGLKFEIDSDSHKIVIDNGHGNSIVISDSGITVLGKRIELN
jgi:exopolysaccharide biosynthesis protein